MAIDRATVTVLHPVDQRGLYPLAPVGEHGIGRDHLEQRGFLGPQRVGQERRHPVIDAEAFGIARDGLHPDFLRDPYGHQVPAHLDPGAQGRGAIEPVRRVLGGPQALGRLDLDRRVDDHRCGGEPAVQGRGINEGLEA